MDRIGIEFPAGSTELATLSINIDPQHGKNHKMTGPEIKARRKELGLTMQDVADRVGLVHRQQIYEWERGDVRPGSKHLVRLAMVLQIDVAALLT